MKITALETIRLDEFANLIWVRVHTDEGLVGLGETFMGAAAVEAYLHETVAPKLLGTGSAPDRGAQPHRSTTISAGAAPASRRAATRRSTSRCGTCSARRTASRSASCSAASPATDPHLQHLRRLPLHPRCARAGGRQLARRRAAAVPTRTSTPSSPRRRARAVAARAGHHRHEDLAVRHRGRAQPAAGTSRPPSSTRRWSRSRKIRRAVGDRMDIMVEFHSLWSLPMAQQARAGARPSSTPTGTRIRSGSTTSRDLARIRRRTPGPGSAPRETLAYTHGRSASTCETGVGRRRDARPVLVRRPVGSAQDRRRWRRPGNAGRAARLHRPGRLRGLAAISRMHAPQRADPGVGARVLHRLVQRSW